MTKLSDIDMSGELLFEDVVEGKRPIGGALLSGGGVNPLLHPHSTMWAKFPGGYWEYKNPWTKKALALIVGIQRDLDAGREVSRGANWHRCTMCGDWINSVCSSMCAPCYDKYN